MALNDIIRQKKKVVYWFIIIVTAPPFLLVWGLNSDVPEARDRNDYVEFQLGGKPVYASEFRLFRERLLAATWNRPCIVDNPILNNIYKQSEGDEESARNDAIYKGYILQYAYLQEAEKAGLGVSPIEVGTYLAAMIPGEKQARETRILEHCRQQRVSRQQFLQGIEEWLKIQKFVTVLDNETPPTGEIAYVVYAQEKATYTIQSQVVNITEKMRAEIRERQLGEAPTAPATDAKTPAATDATAGDAPASAEQAPAPGDNTQKLEVLRKYLERNQGRYATQPKWRFEYVLVPYEAMQLKEVDKEKVYAFYKQNRSKYGEKEFAEIVAKVTEDYVGEQKRTMAENVLKDRFESYVQRCLTEKLNAKITLAEIAADGELAASGLKTGTSGDQALTFAEFKQIPEVGDSYRLVNFLHLLTMSDDGRKKLARLQQHFDNEAQPLVCGAGVFRVRVLEYVPAQPHRLLDEKGNVDGQLLAMLANDYVQEEAEKACRELAQKLGEQLPGETPDAGRKVTTETFTAEELNRSNKVEMAYAELGKPQLFPIYTGGAVSGYEVAVLTQRAVPSRERLARLSEPERLKYEMTARKEKMSRLPHYFRPVLTPGTALANWSVSAFYGNDPYIKITPREAAKQDDNS